MILKIAFVYDIITKEVKEVISMARYKVVKPIDHEKELKKKRSRIHRTVDSIYAVFMIIAIFIGGINQFNNLIVGLVMIVIGIGSIPVALFHIYIIANNWEPVFWYERYETSLPKKVVISKKKKAYPNIIFLQHLKPYFMFYFRLSPSFSAFYAYWE